VFSCGHPTPSAFLLEHSTGWCSKCGGKYRRVVCAPSRSERAGDRALALTTIIIEAADSLRAFRGDDAAYSERVDEYVKQLREAINEYRWHRLYG
jgi:hypothetical protein